MPSELARRTYGTLRGFRPLRVAYGYLRKFPPIRAVGNRFLTALLAGHGERVWTDTKYGWFKMEPRWESNLADVGELDVTPVVEGLLEDGGVFYDVGANMGFYTLIGSKRVGTAGKVIAFEPDPDNTAGIRDVIERNALGNVTVVELAVSDTGGTLAFERSAGLRHSGHLAGVGCDTIDAGERIDVKVTTLDSFCQENPAPDVIKIDVEGGEGNVLRGALNTLRMHRPALVIEVHRQEFMDEVSAVLRQLDYEWNVLEKFEGELVYPCHLLCPSPKTAGSLKATTV
jgi:FkbM family methyltransferase